MGDEEQFARIESQLQELGVASDLDAAELLANGISRGAGYFAKKRNDRARSLVLLAVDLQELLKSEKALAELEKRKPILTEGFFKSLLVLRGEFAKALSGLRP